MQTLLVPSGLAAITLVDMALLKSGDEVLHPGQRLRAGQGARAPRARAAGASRIASTTRWIRRRCARALIGRAHAPGLARGAGLGDDGVPRPRRAGAARARARRDGRARQHLGRRPRLRSVRARRSEGNDGARRRHLGAGADQVPLGRRRRADGIGDDARRRRCISASRRRTCGSASASAPTTSSSCCARCRRCAMRYAAQDARRPRAGDVVGEPARGRRTCSIRRCRGSPGPRALGARCAAHAAGLFSVVFDERFAAHAGRRLRRCAEAVQDRLFVGRTGEPGGPLRPGGDAQAAALAAARWCASRSASKRSRT